MSEIGPAPIPLRECGSCTLCCKVMGVNALDKPPGTWCVHCDIGKGCTIYETRPQGCRNFQCGFLIMPELDERFRPSTCHFVVNADAKRFEIHVDRQRPDAWRKQPYYSWIKRISRLAVARKMVVMVFVGPRCWAIYPDRDDDLGIARAGDQGVMKLVDTVSGRRLEMHRVPSDPSSDTM